MSARIGMGVLVALALGCPAVAARVEAQAAAVATDAQQASSSAAPPVLGPDGLEHLVPELAADPYRLEPGPRPFLHRFSVSPAYGSLGSEPMFAFRLAYNPNDWLGYEWSVAHNPGQSVHAVLHGLAVQVRRPLGGRLQPYLTGGYGMVMVNPGASVNADPVTKNALNVGGGLEFYIRNDLALRGDMQLATVFGKEKDRDGVVAYRYLQQTIGLSFYRLIRP